MKCVEQEMSALDEEERIDRPPKNIEAAADSAIAASFQKEAKEEEKA